MKLSVNGVIRDKAEVGEIDNARSVIIDGKDEGGGGAVESVNGKTGAVVLNASDVGAATSSSVSSAVSGHNSTKTAHSNIELAASNIASGTLSKDRLPLATTDNVGAVRPDGATITVNNGVISAQSGGGGGFQGFTLTISSNLTLDYLGQEHLGSAPVYLHKPDGTYITLDLAWPGGAQYRGQVYENIIAVSSGGWTVKSESGGEYSPRAAVPSSTSVTVWGSSSFARYILLTCGQNSTKLLPWVTHPWGASDATLWQWDKGFCTALSIVPLVGDTILSGISSGCPCLLAGTKVRLADGTEKPIEEITYDDELLVWDFDNGKLSSAKPLWIKVAQDNDYYYHSEFEDGRELKTTGRSATGWGHRFFDVDKNKFVYNSDGYGNTAYTLDGNVKHVSCERVEGLCTCYNVITDYHMNLFANGILTSCSYNNIYPIKDMKFVKDNRDQRPFEAYDVPLKYYKGLRLSEQTVAPEQTYKYIMNLVKLSI